MRGFAQQRVWERANRLSLSQLACLGRHTVSNLLCACGRQFHDWSADYRVFSKDRWDVQQLFVPVVQGILDLAPDKSVFVTALDDTLLRKTGTRTPGVGYRRDPLSPPFHCNFIRAQRFIQLSGLLPSAPGASPARAIPIRYEHVPPVAKPKRSACAEEWKTYRRQCRVQNLSTRGRHILHQTRGQLDQQHDARDRPLIACVDGSYTNKTVLKGLPQRTTLIGRLRKDAKLFFPPRDQEQPARGAKRKYGRRAPTPEALRQDASVPWQEVRAFGAGKIHTFRVKTIGPVLWKKAGYDRPLRLVVIAPVSYRPRKRSRLLYRQPAYLICTDPNLPLEKTLQFYLWRWDIEVNHRDEKQIIGVGQAQVTSRQSVDRHPRREVLGIPTAVVFGGPLRGHRVSYPLARPPKPHYSRHRKVPNPRHRLQACATRGPSPRPQCTRRLRRPGPWAHAHGYCPPALRAGAGLRASLKGSSTPAQGNALGQVSHPV